MPGIRQFAAHSIGAFSRGSVNRCALAGGDQTAGGKCGRSASGISLKLLHSVGGTRKGCIAFSDSCADRRADFARNKAEQRGTKRGDRLASVTFDPTEIR